MFVIVGDDANGFSMVKSVSSELGGVFGTACDFSESGVAESARRELYYVVLIINV